jgi:hypothetical protein
MSELGGGSGTTTVGGIFIIGNLGMDSEVVMPCKSGRGATFREGSLAATAIQTCINTNK